MTRARSSFARGRHLAIAVVGLGHAPLVMWAMLAARQRFADQSGTAASYALGAVFALCFAALCAWLACERFDTRAGVTVVPRAWRREHWRPVAVFVAVEAVMACSLPSASTSELMDFRRHWLDAYVEAGTLLAGWLVLECIASSLAEELVYRALLLRGLEGYFKRPVDALVVHAVVFELVHVFVYGLPFSGGVWFGYGLIYGYAFQVTRSVLVPTVLHVTHNLWLAAVIWQLTS